MYVGGVESGVCGFYTTLHTEYCYSCTLYTGPLAPPWGGGYLFESSALWV